MELSKLSPREVELKRLMEDPKHLLGDEFSSFGYYGKLMGGLSRQQVRAIYAQLVVKGAEPKKTVSK